jgi:hypothetical protein
VKSVKFGAESPSRGPGSSSLFKVKIKINQKKKQKTITSLKEALPICEFTATQKGEETPLTS